MAELMIRDMILEDLPEVFRIETENFRQPWSVGQFLNDIAGENTGALCLCEGDRVLGYACTLKVLDELHLTNISVDPSLQGRGYGQMLLDRVTQIARRNRCALVTLEVREGNAGAIHLYEKNNFTTVGRRRNYYAAEREDALIMNRNLGREV